MTHELLTIGQIAEQLKEPPQRVAYVIRKHRLKAVQRIGIIRLFGVEQLKAIKEGLYNIQVRRAM